MPADNFIEIDPLRLDEEWLRQPELYLDYAERLAEAKKLHAQAKAQLDLTNAKLYTDICERPSYYGLMKTTKDLVDAVITQEEDFQKATQALIKAKYNMDLLDAAVTALDHRKKALENMVWLHGQSYFATPRDKGGTNEAAKDGVRRRGQRTREE